METVIATNILKELKNPDSPKSLTKPIALSTIRIVKVEAPEIRAHRSVQVETRDAK